MIAVILGWLVLGESLSPAMLFGAAVIVAGVAVVTTPGHWFRRKPLAPLKAGNQVPLAKNRV